MVVSAKDGAMVAVTGSGIRDMSESLIAFHPAIEEPSNIMPSAKVSSSIIVTSKVTCCHLPRGSVKRKSTYFTSLSLIFFRTSFAVVIEYLPLCVYAFHKAACDWCDGCFWWEEIADRVGPCLLTPIRLRLIRIPPF